LPGGSGTLLELNAIDLQAGSNLECYRQMWAAIFVYDLSRVLNKRIGVGLDFPNRP